MRLAIGAQFGDGAVSGTGSVYLFLTDGSGGWLQSQKMFASDGGYLDNFGLSISFSNNVMVIGAPMNQELGFGVGAVYLYMRQEDGAWSQSDKLLPTGAPIAAEFGVSVSIDEDWLAVGASGDRTDTGMPSGAVYIFNQDPSLGWIQTQKIIPPETQDGDDVGNSVALSQGTLAIGAGLAEGGDSATGVGYIYTLQPDGTWHEQARLVPSDAPYQGHMGGSCALAGDLVVFGAADANNKGAAYVFQRGSDGTWAQQAKLHGAEETNGGSMGRSVAISGTTVFSGAFYDNTPAGSAAGSVYVFNLACSTGCMGDLNADGTVNLTDLSTQLAHYGESGAPPQDGDLNGDGVIDLTDLAGLLAVYGSICP